jgi:2-polyprenyl-6-methoxyphenol hydroxylase-like FAD-dependent oxidoreductase
MTAKLVGRQAVVVGAGMGGLAAARALADHFEQVVVLERDALPSDAGHRAGTPQSRHLHVLLAGGLRALNELFPGFEQDLVQAGAVPLRVTTDMRLELPGFHPFPSIDLGWTTYSMSRPLLERVVRKCSENDPRITLHAGCRVREFVASADHSNVTAVIYENPDGSSERMAADLVVDASGRGMVTLNLLNTIGQKPPEETRIGVDIGYATAIFPIPNDAPSDWKGMMTLAKAPESSRAGLMFPLEGGDQWIATLHGRYGEKPSDDGDEFLSFARQLPTPTLYDAISQAKRFGNIARFGFPASVWRHFERLESFPRGLLPFGDAICRFNPIWGQGMSVAAQEAVLLRHLLGSEGDPLSGLAQAFFAGASELIETPWASAAIPDFALPQTEGHRPDDLDGMLRFNDARLRLATEDPAVYRLIVEVRHLLKPRSVLQEPDLVERVRAIAAAEAIVPREER